MTRILVTGGKGQLALSIDKVSRLYSNLEFIFTDVENLDITNKKEINSFFKKYSIDYCINCAAYTAVDRAESEVALATRINVEGVRNLAESCKEYSVTLVHISTDFVFDGNSSQPYMESDSCSPLSVYGQTKLDGERVIQKSLKNYFVIRTSWLYSEFGNNFMKTMLRLGGEKTELNIVNDQLGTPTYAEDLARVLLKIIESRSSDFGLYHYSNKGVASWHDFAKEIFELEKIEINLSPILTLKYPTPAERPKYSVLDKAKIQNNFGVTIPFWKDSLESALNAFHALN